MSSPKRVSIGVDEVTIERLAKLEKVTGIAKREHLRRAVERYFHEADQLFTAPVVDALAQLPTSTKERGRLDASRAVGPGRTTTLRKRTGAGTSDR